MNVSQLFGEKLDTPVGAEEAFAEGQYFAPSASAASGLLRLPERSVRTVTR
jgi:hypothetical protein